VSGFSVKNSSNVPQPAISGEFQVPTNLDIEPVRLTTDRPIRRPIMTQRWLNLTYAHWRYDPVMVQRLIPPGFTVDTFDGDAWVGLIPFEMRNIAFPLVGHINLGTGRYGTFPETNVRTYIIDPQGRRGVWFFSLDINRIGPTAFARLGYGLPYCYADMQIENLAGPAGTMIRYTSRRRWPGRAHSNIVVKSNALIDVAADSLDAFTSARWALGSRFMRRNVWAEVDHPQWVLFNAELVECDQSLFRSAGLADPTGNPIVRWSPGVSVRIARPHLS
jgi:uncharacterized protein